ncbi:MAG: glucosamine-6-phosphate deaminase [Candidatus Sericytochromatia bacterium]
MRIIQTADYAEMSHTAAILILSQMLEKPDYVLGLATGHTPSGLYRELVRTEQNLGIELDRLHCFHLDEYLGLSPDDPESMACYLRRHLFEPLGVPAAQRHYVPAVSADPEAACRAYEAEMISIGGIDLQILGIGSNGHIAFNEPGTRFDLGTHVAKLSESTRAANARYFSAGVTPEAAMTMGPRTIMQARQILILAAGASKARAVCRMLQEPVSEDCPASVLRFHPDVTVILDREAASGLHWPLPHFKPLPLQVYTNDYDKLGEGETVLIAAPHPDDASIGCGGTLARLKRQGCQLHFVSMSSGHRADIPDTTFEERVAMRMQEGKSEAEVFASSFTPLNLPFYDHHYMPARRDMASLVALMEQIQPDYVFSTSPRDRHPAHRASALIVQEALREYRKGPGRPELWCYEGPWYLFERDDFNTVVTFSPEDLDLKLKGVQAHHSQVSRKRYDLASEALARFRAITVPESRLSSFGSGLQDVGEHIEVFQRLVLEP